MLGDDLMANFNEELEIKNFLNNILTNYKMAKGRSTEGHPLSDVFNGFSRSLEKFANSKEFLVISNSYVSKSVYSEGNTFINNPYVYLQDVLTGNTFYIGYLFRENLQGVYLALQLGKMTIYDEEKPFEDHDKKSKLNFTFKDDFKKIFINTLRSKITKKTKITKNLGKSTEGTELDNTTIYSKYYQKNNIPSEKQLQKDLIDIMGLHKILVHENEELKTLSDPDEIKVALELFKKRFKKVVNQEIVAPTRGAKLPLLWSSKLKIWGYFGYEDNRYYNPFGIGKPILSSTNQTICEINPPNPESVKMTSGVFAKNS